VDYDKNSNADTGLFVKVVPEKWKPAAALVVNNRCTFDSSVVFAVGPAELTTGYNQRMANVQKNLAEMRQQMIARKIKRDARRYVGINRELLLGTRDLI
jgi:hypothetical protein